MRGDVLAAIGVFGVGLWALCSAIADAPALAPGLRVTVGGAWRPADPAAFYDASLYYADRAVARLAAPPGAGLAALSLALAAVEAAPADAYHWTLLAGIAADAGFPEAAAAALARSLALAPDSAALGPVRIALADRVSLPLDAATRAALARDRAAAR